MQLFRGIVVMAVLGSGTTIATSCGDATRPVSPVRVGDSASYTVVPPQLRPHYLANDEVVWLTVDPTRLVVSVPDRAGPDDIAAFGDALGALGLHADSITSMVAARNHLVAWLHSGTLRRTRAVVRSLRSTGRFRFVSAGYRVAADGSPLTLLDVVGVAFKPGVTRDQVVRLAATYGLTILKEPDEQEGRIEYWLLYPSAPSTDPLAIAEVLARHPLVRWADPDKVSVRYLSSLRVDLHGAPA